MNLTSKKANLARALLRTMSDKDKYIGRHSQNVADLMCRLADDMGLAPKHKEEAYIAGLVHDIGKVKVPSFILNKPGPLTTEEYNIIKSHAEWGVHILKKLQVFDNMLHVIRHHHERYDGQGYPAGMRGEDIPLLSRMLAVCDAYDAMTSERCYRLSYTQEEALAELESCAGAQFDPAVSGRFVALLKSDFLLVKAVQALTPGG